MFPCPAQFPDSARRFPSPRFLRANQERQWSLMRKRIVEKRTAVPATGPDLGWLDLSELASVEVTSEDPAFPVESAFDPGGPGWRAGKPGEQEIRLIFDEPVSIRRIQLKFEEHEIERLQEFVLRWSSAQGGASKEIVRQQWNFSPKGSVSETEDYTVDLANVSVLELIIWPDKTSPDSAVASLASFVLK